MKIQSNNSGASVLDNQLLEAFPDPVMLLNDKRELIFGNKASKAMFNIHVGRNLEESFSEPGLLEAAGMVLDKKNECEIELSISRPSIIKLKVKVVAVTSLANYPDAAALIVLRDVSSESIAEKMRRDFVSNVSHELRSPIASLIGFIETLQGPAKEDRESQDRFLAIMASESQRMARMIDDLLSLSRVEATERIRPQDQVNVSELMNEIEELLVDRATRYSMDLKFMIAPNLPIISGDRDELMEVFQNLIDNAVKYGEEGSVINIEANAADSLPEVGGPGIIITVENKGDGIKAEHIARLTERFYRIDKGRSRKMGGTGLGLAIVKHIVNRHRGQLLIQSHLNKETTFTVLLPII
ncbi:MAG: ATP-binding protein [Pseudomonadota bacterium]|nr:ATP-binding protein [Pseudomonadota bacterium]